MSHHQHDMLVLSLITAGTLVLGILIVGAVIFGSMKRAHGQSLSESYPYSQSN